MGVATGQEEWKWGEAMCRQKGGMSSSLLQEEPESPSALLCTNLRQLSQFLWTSEIFPCSRILWNYEKKFDLCVASKPLDKGHSVSWW